MIPEKLRTLSSGRNVLIAIILWLAFSVYLFNFGPYGPLRSAGQGAPLIEESFSTEPDQIAERLTALGSERRDLYVRFQMLDVVNAVLTAAGMTLLLVFIYRRFVGPRNPAGLLVVLPLMLGAVDLLENILLISAITDFPETGFTASLLPTVIPVKLSIAFLIFPVLILGLLFWAIRAFRSRGGKTSKPDSEQR